MTCCAPILIIAFNRPDSCRQVIDAIRTTKPDRIFFAVDGARPDHPDDERNCKSTRDLFQSFDWPCEVKTYYRDTNRGCKYAPPEAISWFFSHVEAGIILEDDCVPTTDFLSFASELLVKYALADHVGMITGNNHLGFQTNKQDSYHFSRYPSIWGWATWKRAWATYDVNMTPYLSRLDQIRTSIGHDENFRTYWWRYVEAVQGGLNTWDVQWAVALLANDLLTIRPKCNLVANSGFTTNSTHTSYEYDVDRYKETQRLAFSLVHPDGIKIDDASDRKLENRQVSIWHRGMTYIGARGGVTGNNFAKMMCWIERQIRQVLQ